MPFRPFLQRVLAPWLRRSGRPDLLFLGTAKYLIIGHLFWVHAYSFSAAQGPSMLPTFPVFGTCLLISRFYRFGRGVRVGDIVVFLNPINDDSAMKRVLGMPGDYVLVNTPGTSDLMVQVPAGHCWLVGDNTYASRDSRTFGPVPLALITGKIVAQWLPFKERKIIRNPLDRP